MASREREREREIEGSAMERYYETTAASRERYDEACEYMPGGNTRGVLYYDPYPAYVDRGSGCQLRDVDGNEYIDFLNNYTSLIHGHTPEEPTERAIEAIRRGSAPGGPTSVEVDWARHIVERVPALERIRFTNSGTEATMNAIRAARAYTGEDVIAKFEGVYHGTADDVQVSVHPSTHLAGAADDPKGVPDSAGVPESTLDDVIVLPFNDTEASIEKLERHRDELGGVMIAPLMGTAIVPGDGEFIGALREFTADNDVPLIFDEVVSFRVTHGGVGPAYGVEPDLVTYGKIIGGGFAVGAFGGRADIMGGYDPRGGSDIVHSGTFNANPVTASAGLAALEAYDEDEIDRINSLCRSLVRGSREAAEELGYDINVHRYGSLFNVYLASGELETYRDVVRSSGDLEERIYMEMLTQGVRTAPKLMGCMSTPMGEEEVEAFVDAFRTALDRLRPEFEVEAPHLLAD